MTCWFLIGAAETFRSLALERVRRVPRFSCIDRSKLSVLGLKTQYTLVVDCLMGFEVILMLVQQTWPTNQRWALHWPAYHRHITPNAVAIGAHAGDKRPDCVMERLITEEWKTGVVS